MLWNMSEKLCLQLISKPLCKNVFYANFEKATQNSILKKFPNHAFVCCNIHFEQSWFRRT